ncbi:hypothetical protein BBJ28_00001989 [Nothophytophthora sp. Chile5]|nr:hypothetical protein BBJ28_00001989 [Nothophytophthora sp. Chile5]
MKVPATALPSSDALGLSPQDLATLEILADSIIEDTLQAYEAYRADRFVSPKLWKPVRSAGGVTVYKDRKEVRASSQKLRAADGLLSPVLSKYSTPALLAVGTVRGSLDDSMYGDFYDSDEAAQLRAAYVKGQPYEDFRVLQQISVPSEDEPYRFCGLVWATLVSSGRPFVQQRDLLLLVSSGEAFTKTGERFGYRVEHSVSLPTLPKLDDFKLVRAKMSMCCLKWPLHGDEAGDVDTLEVFQKGFFSPMGSARDRAVTRLFVNSLLLTPLTLEAALSKKLVWMRGHAPGRKRTYVSPYRSSSFAMMSSSPARETRATTVTMGILTRVSAAAADLVDRLVFSEECAGRCQTNTCKQTRKIVVEVSSSGVTLRPLVFCIVCVAMAERHSASGFAQKELTHGSGFTTSESVGWSQNGSIAESASYDRGGSSRFEPGVRLY